MTWDAPNGGGRVVPDGGGVPLRVRAGDPPAECLQGRRSLVALAAAGLALVGSLAIDTAFAWRAGGALPPAPALAAAKTLDALLVIAVAVLLVRRLPTSGATFGLRPLPVRNLMAWGCVGLASLYAVLLSSAAVLAIAQALGGGDWIIRDTARRLDLLSALVDIPGWQATLLLVAVAVHEEILFRGLLMPAMRGAGGWIVALLGSSIVFGVLHVEQGMLGIVQATLLGICLGGLVLLSGSVWPAVLAHFAFDRLQFALIRALLPFLEHLGYPPGG